MIGDSIQSAESQLDGDASPDYELMLYLII